MERAESHQEAKSLARRNRKPSSNGCRDRPFSKYTHHLQIVSTDLIMMIPNEMHQFDLLYVHSDTLYRNKYNFIISGIDVVSRYKVTRPLRTKQAKHVADLIADIYKVGSLNNPKVFQCDNRSELKAEVPKILEKHGVMI